MVTESTDPLCDAVDCGEHGACKVVGNEAACECSDSFAGDACDECESGLVLEGAACVEPCEAEGAPDCGEHGVCEAEGDAPVCTCEHPYAGDECLECAEGFALQPNGECAPDCGECGAHAFCNEALMTPSCECVAGYTKMAEDCVWSGDGATGGFVNGELANDEGWTLDKVEIAAGQATFENERIGGTCSVGSLQQTITMPARVDAEQLVMDVEVLKTCSESVEEDCPALQLEVGSSIKRLTVAGPVGAKATLPVCLGDSAYGGEVRVTIRPGLAFRHGTQAFECDETEWPRIEGVSIRAATAGECPSAGTASGSLSSSNGWSASSSTFSGGQITVSGPLSTLVQVPSNMGVAVTATGTSTMLTVEGLDAAFLVTGSTTQCLPSWTRGSVVRVGFRELYPGAKVTAFSVAANPSCTVVEFDRGFERDSANNVRSWDALPKDAIATPSVSAFQGTKVFRAVPPAATPAATGASADAVALTLLPLLDDSGAGLAITARRRVVVPAGAAVEGSYTVNIGLARTFETSSTSWTSIDLVCLEPQWAGQLVSLRLSASVTRTSGSGRPEMLVDDVATTLTDSCD
jgi:hypothetical protein